ncbi:MAG: hypothetical protein JNM18_07220, partial [Planctomycetaceae bacterium]|nr:hypothetical protein [Planctomycetaceae bacterium]
RQPDAILVPDANGVLRGVGTGAIAGQLSFNGQTWLPLKDPANPGEKFYMTGKATPAMGKPNSTARLLIYKASNPKKVFLLDFHSLAGHSVHVPGGTAPRFHFQQEGGMAAIDGLKFERFNANSKYGVKGAAALGNTITVFKHLGRPLFALGLASAGFEIYHAQDWKRETVAQGAAIAGGGLGGWAGFKAGAGIGAGIGVWFGGAGAAPGAFIGGVVGALSGGYVGSEVGDYLARATYDWAFTPLEKEEWLVLGEADCEE